MKLSKKSFFSHIKLSLYKLLTPKFLPAGRKVRGMIFSFRQLSVSVCIAIVSVMTLDTGVCCVFRIVCVVACGRQ